VQPGERVVVRAGAAARRLHRDERAVLRVGSRPKKSADRVLRGDMKHLSAAVAGAVLVLGALASAQRADEVRSLLEQYVAIDTSNPPGHTDKAADFLASVLTREGIAVTRYESAPGKSIVLARLSATSPTPAGKPILLL